MKKLLIVLVAGMFLASCSKDPNKVTNEALEGEWEVTSMTIGGEDVYGPDLLIDDATHKFTMDEDFTGSYTTTATFFPGDPDWEETSSTNGTYEVSNEGETVTMTDSDGDKTVSSITIEGDTYTMTYTDDNDNEVVEKAKKK